MYEKRSDRLAPPRVFLRRLARHAALTLALIAVSLAAGMLGYHALEHLGWTDAYLNAAMLLGGMGPVDPPRTEAGKLFAGTYALYCGLVVIVAAGILLAPFLHRLMHRFHLETGRDP
ncbi:MAG: hypothetical protein JSR73_12500 [Proteobacteria bacterium]|nr:hypothetical protein [Pseudomonadota bacterium]